MYSILVVYLFCFLFALCWTRRWIHQILASFLLPTFSYCHLLLIIFHTILTFSYPLSPNNCLRMFNLLICLSDDNKKCYCDVIYFTLLEGSPRDKRMYPAGIWLLFHCIQHSSSYDEWPFILIALIFYVDPN